MKINELEEIQKALLHSIFFTDSWFDSFLSARSIIDPRIFGKYNKLSLLAYSKNSKEELSYELLSTEMIKENLSELYIDILSATYTIPNFWNDVKILLKELVMWTPGDQYDKVLSLHKIMKELDEKKTFDFSKRYLIRELYDWAMADLERKEQRKSKWLTLGYSTGFKLLDKYTEGIQKWTVTRLNAYSNVGKSKFSYQIVNQLLDQNAHVIYFSLEVPKNTVIYNLVANKYKMPIWDVYRMDFWDIDFWELFTKNLEIIDDKYNLSDILQYAELRKPDAIIIDFVQNIQAEWKEYERMTNIAVSIQQLAIKNNIAVFDLSQVSNEWANYASGDAIPSKWSGALVASADVGLMLKREKWVEWKIVLHIAKNKFWQNGKSIDYSVDFSRWLFIEEWESLSNAF